MMGREFDLEEAEPHIRNKGWSPEFQNPKAQRKATRGRARPPKVPLLRDEMGQALMAFCTKCCWSAMRPRIAFIVFTLAILCATCDLEPKW
jgi:hypothetical protein